MKKYLIEKLNTLPVSFFKIKAAVLYGSYSRTTQNNDSDIDLLIVAEGLNPKKHRRGKEIASIKEWFSGGLPLDILLLTSSECISNFRNHNPLFLDIATEGLIVVDENNFLENLIHETKVYISEKKIEKLSDGWKFPVLFREATFLSEVSNKDFAKVMLTDGEHDFAIAIKIMEEGYFDKSVYHFQQAAEKAVKAVLKSFGEFKKTHFIGNILAGKLKEINIEQEWKEKLLNIAKICEEIEPEVTWSRYPGIDNNILWVPYQEYTIDDANQLKEKTEKVIKTSKIFFEWWFKK